MANRKNELTEEEIQPLADEEIASDNGILASWQIPEYIKHDRRRSWYIYFTMAMIALLIYSYFSNNPLFAVIIVLFLVIFIITERRQPKMIQFSITADGLLIHDRLVTWRSLQNFYIVYYPPQIKNLYFQPKNSLRSIINVPLEAQNPVEVRELLLQFLPEDLQKEEMPTSEGITRLLKL